jgi:hypothetical protein
MINSFAGVSISIMRIYIMFFDIPLSLNIIAHIR